MHIRTALGQKLISRETALEMCRMIVIDWYGAEEYDRQKPLQVEDNGSVWKITGSRVLPPRPTAADPGPVRMSISKLDAAIVSFTH
jgi:hypothetical protein